MEMNYKAIQNAVPLINTPAEVAVVITMPNGGTREFHAGNVERLTHVIMADDTSKELGFRECNYERAWHVMCSNLCLSLEKLG